MYHIKSNAKLSFHGILPYLGKKELESGNEAENLGEKKSGRLIGISVHPHPPPALVVCKVPLSFGDIWKRMGVSVCWHIMPLEQWC